MNWLNSYSLYLDSLRPWFEEHLGKAFVQNRTQAMLLLQQEASLNEIVQLVRQGWPGAWGSANLGDRQNDSRGLSPAKCIC